MVIVAHGHSCHLLHSQPLLFIFSYKGRVSIEVSEGARAPPLVNEKIIVLSAFKTYVRDIYVVFLYM